MRRCRPSSPSSPRSAKSPSGGVPARAAVEESAQGDRGGAVGCGGRDRRRRGDRNRRQRVSQRPARSRILRRAACCAETSGCRRQRERKDHRRAHQYQSQQSRAYRPSAQRDSRRYLRAHAARHRRSASRCRTTSTTPACRWPTSWSGFSHLEKKIRRRSARADRRHAIRLCLLGCLRARLRTITRSIRKRLAVARTRRCMPSKRATGDEAEMAHLVADAIVDAHLTTMWRLNIDYDVLPRESEILHLQFWATAFEQLKERKAIYFETEGKNKGCWVMPASAFRDGDRRGRRRQQGHRALERHRDVRRQGHRLSALEIRPARQGFLLSQVAHVSGRARSLGVDRSAASGTTPHFGGGARVYNVIDSRQSYLQDVVVAGLRALGYDEAGGKQRPLLL